MAYDQKIKVSLDGGVTYVEAKEGVRIIYEDVILPGEDETGELHINATHEGLIQDIWVTRETSLDHNIATKSESIEDITHAMVENDA
jgi:pyruvate carboxylase